VIFAWEVLLSGHLESQDLCSFMSVPSCKPVAQGARLQLPLCPSVTPPSPCCLPQTPGQVILTFYKITLQDEKNMCFIQDSKPSRVDCIPYRNENPSVALQSWNKSGLLGLSVFIFF
jgi:hypothetical protein